MQSPIVTVVFLLALFAVGGTVFYYTWQPQPADPAGISDSKADEMRRRVADLEAEVSRLREEAKSRSQAPERAAIDPVSDARIEAAVAKYMAAHPVGASAKQPASGAARDLGQTYLHLQGELSEEEFLAVWAQLREEGRAEDMVKMFEENAANNPNSADAQAGLGVAYLMHIQGMPPGPESGKIALNADKAFDAALKLDQNHWDARFVKAQALSFWPPMFGKQAEAIEHLEILRRQQEGRSAQDPNAQTYMMLGNLYSQQGKNDEAMEAWKKGATLFPNDPGLRTKVGGK